MAQITWRNIDLPDFRAPIAGLSEASRTLDRALGNFGNIADVNRQTTQQNLANMDQQGQAAILEQIAGLTTPEQLQEAVGSGGIAALQAGMSGAGRIAAQQELVRRSDTLLDQEAQRQEMQIKRDKLDIDRDYVDLAQQRQDLAVQDFNKIDLPRANREAADWQNYRNDVQRAQTLMEQYNPMARAQQLQQKISDVYSKYPEYLNDDGTIDTVNAPDDVLEAIDTELKNLEVNAASEQVAFQNGLAAIEDNGLRQNATNHFATMMQLTREGNQFTKSEIANEESKFIQRNPGIKNNPYYLRDQQRATGKTNAQLLLEKNPKFVDNLSSSAKEALIAGTVPESVNITLKGESVAVPITYEDLAIALGSSRGISSVDDFFGGSNSSEVLEEIVRQRIGKDATKASLNADHAAYVQHMNQARRNSSASPEMALRNTRTSISNARELNKARASLNAQDKERQARIENLRMHDGGQDKTVNDLQKAYSGLQRLSPNLHRDLFSAMPNTDEREWLGVNQLVRELNNGTGDQKAKLEELKRLATKHNKANWPTANE